MVRTDNGWVCIDKRIGWSGSYQKIACTVYPECDAYICARIDKRTMEKKGDHTKF